jgi:excisionase family DNA binding protein
MPGPPLAVSNPWKRFSIINLQHFRQKKGCIFAAPAVKYVKSNPFLKVKKGAENHLLEISDMAGMFYSLQEAAEKLKKTEEELKRLVKQGKLREFRDGAHLLFKIDEVEVLMADTSIMAPALTKEPSVPEISEPELPEMEIPQKETTEPVTPLVGAEPAVAPEAKPPEMEVPAQAEQPADIEEILLAPETGIPLAPGELTDADTTLTSEGISVLGETDRDYQMTDDTMAETIGTTETTGATGATPEPSLEEIEGDVSMDTFGSGSGLLDLSLQADDTSLGAILDEIYTTEGAKAKEPAPAKSGSPEEAYRLEASTELAGGEISEEELASPQPIPEAAAMASAYAYVEPEPDTISNTLGMLLFLPLALFVCTAVAAAAGLAGVVPSLLANVQGVIWYIMIGAVVVTGVVVGAGFMLSKPSPPSGAVAKKEKKAKPPKKSKKGKESPPPAPEDTAA